jgi:hypothetical protein
LSQEKSVGSNLAGLSPSLTGAGSNLLGQGSSAIAPALNFYTNLASGNTAAETEAGGSLLAQNTQGMNAARENIFSTAPRGAARDFALSQLPIQGQLNASNILSQAKLGGLQSLEGIGSTLFGESNALTGAGIGAGGQAASIFGNVAANQEQQAAATLSAIGGLISGVTDIFTPGLSSAFSNWMNKGSSGGGGSNFGGSPVSPANYGGFGGTFN